jgi:hypothetical protein
MSAWGVAIVIVLLSAAGCNESQSIEAAPRDDVAAANHRPRPGVCGIGAPLRPRVA